ncbi:hypothetical protein [Succinivibrio dextrinosolvens]|jgi:hypothetical protein|uniref:hypothetical protein n=1 Tax=Succinivibrio dextrinosolvens TaxID=83771 RepID=UPI00241E38EA|nr:hypothetical protein [Succinivibrio dextrinosolvens]MBE6423057.1 hypothetical protein [Succinivibrio dextrinosolvens]
MSKKNIFVLDEGVQSILEDVGGFNVDVDNLHVSLETQTDAGEDWYFEIEHKNSTFDFIQNFRLFAEDFDVEDEFRSLFEANAAGTPDAITLYQDQEEKKELLYEVGKRLKYQQHQIEALSCQDFKKIKSPIPEKVVKFLNENDIIITSIDEYDHVTDKYNRVINEKFTSCSLAMFVSSEEPYNISFEFNDSYIPADLDYVRYSFGQQFAEAAYSKYAFPVYDLICAYDRDPSEGLSKLKLLSENRKKIIEITNKLEKLLKQ